MAWYWTPCLVLATVASKHVGAQLVPCTLIAPSQGMQDSTVREAG